jgi:hypothetical protein
MRRALLILLVGTILAVLGAGPALAQRDPFDPASGGQSAEEEPSTQGETAGETETEDPVTRPQPQPQVDSNGSDALANTGTDVSPWLVLAYGLIVAGAAAVVVARTWRAESSHR